MLWRVDIRIIYSSIKGNVKLYWSTQITCKPKAAGKPDLLKKGQIFAGTTTPKLTNTSVLKCFITFGQVVYFHNTDNKQPFAEVPQIRCS